MKLDLLFMRSVLLNAAIAALLWAGYDSGIIPDILSKDHTPISKAIIGLFAVGWLLCVYRHFEASVELNKLKRTGDSDFPAEYEKFMAYCSMRKGVIDFIAVALPTAGFFGTVFGFLVALSSLDVASLTVNSVGAQLGQMTNGASTALVTTLTGCSTWFVLGANKRLLEGGYERILLRG